MYPEPEVFNPDRFRGFTDKAYAKAAEFGGDMLGPTDPRDYYFGFGRRICPGMLLAQYSAWMAMASLLATFEIRPKDPSMIVDVEYATDGVLRYELQKRKFGLY